MKSSKQKAVIFFIHSLGSRGDGKVVLNLAKGMADKEVKVFIYVISSNMLYDAGDSVVIQNIGSEIKPLRDRKDRAKIFSRYIDSIAADYNLLQVFAVSNRAIKIASHLKRDDLFLCVHIFLSKVGKWQRFFDFTSRREWKRIFYNNNVVTVSEGIEDDIISNIGAKPRRHDVIYNPIDLNYIQKSAAQSLDEDASAEIEKLKSAPYIVHVGIFDRVKRHDVLFQAFSASSFTGNLALLGQFSNADVNAIVNLATQFGVEKRVIILGFHKNPYRIISKSKLLVLSSEKEGLPMVLIEAIACGVPVVSTDCKTGPSEIMINGYKDLLTPVSDYLSLAKKIDDVISGKICVNPAEAELDRFAVTSVCDQYLSL